MAPEFFEWIGKASSLILMLVGAWWAFEKWRQRDEHFPRIYFEVGVNFIGRQEGLLIVELVATLDNRGVVPLRIKNFTFKLLGLKKSDALVKGRLKVRRQLLFPHCLEEGRFVPETWEYSFVYPGVRTEYNFVTYIPSDVSFIRIQGDFDYLRHGESHHAAKVLAVP